MNTRPTRDRLSWALLVVVSIALALVPMPSTAKAGEWHAAAGGGGNFNFAPEFVGRGWVLFDSVGTGVVGKGDLHLYWNTDKIHAGIEKLSFAKGKLAFFAFVEGEIVLAQLLRDYFKRGLKVSEFGFNASYVLLSSKLQWYPGKHQTVEILLPVRHWWFYEKSDTSGYQLPSNTWVFEPRIGYVFWKVDAAAKEWEAHRFYPRITGVALGISGGLDVRSTSQQWGIADGRNDPGKVIYVARQWLRAGWQFVPLTRLQVNQWGSYGWGEDDITRNRIGGTSPYVVPVPGLPWTGLVSERLFSAQLGFHIKAKETSAHEFGVLVGGGAFNDVTRDGALNTYGGTGGLALFADLRFGEDDRYQIHTHLSWGFPTVWLLDSPYIAGLLTFGARVF
jgi:hypothetical protein